MPMGIDTPTNFPFCNAGPVLGTKFPSIIPNPNQYTLFLHVLRLQALKQEIKSPIYLPIAIAKKIHRAKNRSNQPKDLKADDFLAKSGSRTSSCFSISGIDDIGEFIDFGCDVLVTTSSDGRTFVSVAIL